MPKTTRPSRTFHVTSVKTAAKVKGKDNYITVKSTTPAGAASKAANKICRNSAIHGTCALTLEIRDVTKGARTQGKEYEYHVRRHRVPASERTATMESRGIKHKLEVCRGKKCQRLSRK